MPGNLILSEAEVQLWQIKRGKSPDLVPSSLLFPQKSKVTGWSCIGMNYPWNSPLYFWSAFNLRTPARVGWDTTCSVFEKENWDLMFTVVSSLPALSPLYDHCCCRLVGSRLYLPPHGLWPARLLSLWDFPGRNTGVGCHFFLQGIFLIQGSNPHLLGLCFVRRILYTGASKSLLVYFIDSSAYILTPHWPFLSPLILPLVTINLFSVFVSLFLFYK